MFDKLKEECGVYGVSLTCNEASGYIYNGLLALQHRGQEGAGISVAVENDIVCYKDSGLASEVFGERKLNKLPASFVGIGHCRYSTTGNNAKVNLQPHVTEYLTGRLAAVHNGNLINGDEIKNYLQTKGIKFSSTSDAETISALVAYELLHSETEEKGVINAINKLKGAFSVVIMTSGGTLYGIRDPWGFRPLCLGQNEHGIAISSESCGLDCQNFDLIREVEAGEMVIIENAKIIKTLIYKQEKKGMCIFEYVYFARPDSVIENVSVFQSRYNMGKYLAREFGVDGDVVCGVPDSGLEAAMGYSQQSGIPLVSAFVKNRYLGRSFIYPTQSQRENIVALKLNPLKANVKDKRIILIDDSIVRGTTCAKIIRALRKAGAKEIHLRISSPMFKHSCYFGTDVDNEENLIANRMTKDEIAQSIGADSLEFISLDGLKEACEKNSGFCTGCFDGIYPIDMASQK